MNLQQQIDLIRNLKGAPAGILLILALSGRSLTARELEEATGYSDKPITKAVNWLAPRGYIQNNGRARGWSLGPAGRTLFAGVLGNIPHPSASQLTDRDPAAAYQLPPGRNNSEPHPENLRTSAPQEKICLDPGLLADDPGSPARQTNTDPAAAARKNPDLALFLQRIGLRDPAYSRILARDTLPAAVAWYWESLGQDWMDNPSGWLVRRLDSGADPLPAYAELAHAWLALDDADLDDFYAVCAHPYGPRDYWTQRGLSPAAVAAYQAVKSAGGLQAFDDVPRPASILME